ncbi:MAG TPA: ABC transporter permease [Vicinamibacterales bacterium]|nr:ABC transporter permease [Vicinamibacterales bacterium]
MIPTLLRVSWTNLKRDRVAQALTFLLPILFFSIFATVFGNQGRDGTSRVRIAVVDEDGSELSRRIVAGLQQETALRVRVSADQAGQGATLTRAAAEQLVKNGDVPVAVVLPKGIGASATAFTRDPAAPRIQLLADVSDPVAPQMVNGLLQKVTMTAAPDLMMQGGIQQFEQHAGVLTPGQRSAVDAWLPQLKPAAGSAASAGAAGSFGVGVETVDVMRQGRSESLVSFYAAGVGVMFLLFSVSAGGGTLLDEVDSGTLDRVLSTRVGMSGLLVGKWLFLALVGVLQLTVMFVWGRVAFGLDLFSHVPGFLIMTLVTAGAAAAFGLMLATLARTRAQLSAISTIIILTMSALGGSMFPRFLMSETMQKLGLLTFNGWALDGYLKVFWRDAPVLALWPQVAVLIALTAVFLALARTFARRWETA